MSRNLRRSVDRLPYRLFRGSSKASPSFPTTSPDRSGEQTRRYHEPPSQVSKMLSRMTGFVVGDRRVAPAISRTNAPKLPLKKFPPRRNRPTPYGVARALLDFAERLEHRTLPRGPCCACSFRTSKKQKPPDHFTQGRRRTANKNSHRRMRDNTAQSNAPRRVDNCANTGPAEFQNKFDWRYTNQKPLQSAK